MKVQCKYIAKGVHCGKMVETCWHTKACMKIVLFDPSFSMTQKGSDCRSILDLDWVDYIMYKDKIVVVEE